MEMLRDFFTFIFCDLITTLTYVLMDNLCACFSVDSEDVVVVEATNQGYYPPPNISLPTTDPVQLQGKVYFHTKFDAASYINKNKSREKAIRTNLQKKCEFLKGTITFIVFEMVHILP